MNQMQGGICSQYESVRQQSIRICEPLEVEDYLVQPMADASPPKWHLAHITWFFETFVLKPFLPGYQPFSDVYEVLFNSYYNGVGQQHPRAKRGLLSRPTVADIFDYRAHVDGHMRSLLTGEITPKVNFRTILGMNHEQQHQELLFTDLKYNLGHNPLSPIYQQGKSVPDVRPQALNFLEFSGGIYQIGIHADDEFVFDNESPRHDVLIEDFRLANRLVTNAEFIEFVEDGGYQRPELWLADAWALQCSEGKLSAPLYWQQRQNKYFVYTLAGLVPVSPLEPVCHVSGYEADAFARWKGARLPTEMEWEVAAKSQEQKGIFVEDGFYHPLAADTAELGGMFGNLWEWTQSSYSPYPGFKSFQGQLGEYNGKFMANQLVLRGGSCVTPRSHIRPSYRNFFYPADRWQFSGIRLAKDV